MNVNEYILITHSVNVTLRCKGEPSIIVGIPLGVFSIHLKYPCDLKSDSWLIRSQFTYSYNVTISSKLEFALPPESYLTPLLQLNMSDKETEFKMLPNVDFMKLKLSELETVHVPVASSWNINWKWSSLALIVMVVPIVLAIFWFRARTRRSSSAKVIDSVVNNDSIELEVITPAASTLRTSSTSSCPQGCACNK